MFYIFNTEDTFAFVCLISLPLERESVQEENTDR